jgi:hypothetical protein
MGNIGNPTGAVSEAWPKDQLRTLADRPRPFAVVIDPANVVQSADLETLGNVVKAHEWIDLRRAYELDGRDATNTARTVVHLVCDAFHEGRDLPWDIEQAADVVTIRLPFPPEWLTVWRELDDARRVQLVVLLAGSTIVDVPSLVTKLFGVSLPQTSVSHELEEVIRLRTRGGVPPALWSRIRNLVRGDIARSLCSEPVDRTLAQAAWSDWMTRGATSARAPLFEAIGPAVLELQRAGLISPSSRLAATLPAWVDAGTGTANPLDVARALLSAAPDPWPPTTVDEWFAAATWWGDLRAALASAAPVPEDLHAAAIERWGQLDAAFGPWIRTNLPQLLVAARSWPLTVDKIAPFLARRLRNGTERIVLVVVDGMAYAQWSLLRELCGLKVDIAGSSAALIPTLTEHSRQAIFAGAPPLEFANTLTWEKLRHNEEERWLAFWQNEEIGPARYIHLGGATVAEVPNFGSERVVGIAVLAVDELLHGADLLADAQVAADLRAWASHGFLTELVDRACQAGFEVWITADHGNVEAVPSGKHVQEGLEVDRAGRRVRHYANRTRRDAARAEGIAWDPPWLPKDAPAYLFATGRTAFLPAFVKAEIVHGGMSLDEVVVPLNKVSR